jgi:glycosyltransferase involved in cell wall biosynthesis
VTKALFVLHTAAPSGAELATARMVSAMGDMNVAVVFTEDGPMAEWMCERGVETTVLPNTFDSRSMTIDGRSVRRLLAGFLALVRLGWALGLVARRSGASVLVAESSKALVMCAVAARRARIPVVWQVHDRISAEYFGRPLAALVRGLGWAISDGYLANSRSTLSSLITWRKDSCVAHPGVEIDTDFRRRDQRSPTETVIAVVGRLTRWKGQDVFLRALADVRLAPAQAYLVGGTFFDEEPFREELELLAKELDLQVTFTGHVDDPGSYMRDADILVHCSVLPEPFGQVVVEGMSAGCAVIASGPGGTTEIVEHGVNGLLVDGGGQAQLTAALDELIGDIDLRQRLSTAAQLRAQRFDITATARDASTFLDRIAATQRRRRSHV